MKPSMRHHVANRVVKIFLKKAWPKKKIKKADNKTFMGETGSLICSNTGFKFGKLLYNEYVSTFWLRNSSLRRLFTHEKGLCKNDKSFLYNLPKLETPQMYNRRVGKLFIAGIQCILFLTYLYNEIAVSSEKGRMAGTCNHMHEACEHNEEWEKPEAKELTLCGSIYRSCWGWGWGSWSEQPLEDWLGRDGTSWSDKNTLYGVRVLDYRGASLAKSVLFKCVYLNVRIFYLKKKAL